MSFGLTGNIFGGYHPASPAHVSMLRAWAVWLKTLGLVDYCILLLHFVRQSHDYIAPIFNMNPSRCHQSCRFWDAEQIAESFKEELNMLLRTSNTRGSSVTDPSCHKAFTEAVISDCKGRFLSYQDFASTTAACQNAESQRRWSLWTSCMPRHFC